MRRPSPFDIAIAAGLFAVGVTEVLGARLAEDVVEGPTGLNLAAVALMTLPLAFRRQAPFPVALVIYGTFGARALAADPLELYPPVVATLIATYSLAAYGELRDALIGFGVLALSVGIAAERGSGGDAAPEVLPTLILTGGVLAAGRVVRVRQDRALAVARTAEERAATAAADERARLARELHDAVSHSLASIVMQAGGAQDVLRKDPDRALTALGAIERTARGGLGEMRRLLGLLGEEEAPREPQPGLARLDDLLGSVRQAGLAVETEVEGERRPLPPAVDLSAYRIVQESLTNAMKHAGPCRATVRLRYEPEALDVEVVDDGRGPGPTDGAGRGLAGMRERTAVLGGRLEAGPAAGGRGFAVRARLPIEEEP